MYLGFESRLDLGRERLDAGLEAADEERRCRQQASHDRLNRLRLGRRKWRRRRVGGGGPPGPGGGGGGGRGGHGGPPPPGLRGARPAAPPTARATRALS